MSKLAVVGAGLIGRSWAIVFARAGWQVRLFDADADTAEAAPAIIRGALDELAKHGLCAEPAQAADRVTKADSIAQAVEGANLVQENLPELVEVKRKIFAELDGLVGVEAIIASSTSAIVASRFTEGLIGRERCLVAHPVNPPHLVPLVELCGAPWTSPGTMGRAREIYRSVGQVPVVISSELEGFALNRLQGALLAEALRLAGKGVVSPQDLDAIVCHGLGMRWSFMGPFATIELNAPGGIADYCARYGPFYRRLSADPASSEVWDGDNIARVLAAWGDEPDRDQLCRRRDWRDRRLMALAAHKLKAVQTIKD